jgi:ERCC4-type nuclease
VKTEKNFFCATAAEICAIEGVGPKLAETIVDFFAKLKRRGPQIEDETAGDNPGLDESETGVVTYHLKPNA